MSLIDDLKATDRRDCQEAANSLAYLEVEVDHLERMVGDRDTAIGSVLMQREAALGKLQALMPYVSHKPECIVHSHPDVCNCGLARVLA